MARESIVCPRCGSQSGASVQTCANCGTDLEWAREHWSSVVSGPQETYAPIILHTDDEIGALTLVGIMLEHAGYRVAKAKDAFIALELLKRFIPDLIITGVMMPGMDGIEMIRHLKADPVLQKIPVVVLSGRGDDETVGRAMEAGATLHLSKPILQHDLGAVVTAILSDERLPLVFFAHDEAPEELRVDLGNKHYNIWAPHKSAYEDIDRWRKSIARLLNTPLEPGVIAVKFHLCDLEGLDVLAQLKGDASICHIPVVMLAEEPDPELEQRALELGASAVYTGPLDAERLAEVFRAVMEASNSTGKNRQNRLS